MFYVKNVPLFERVLRVVLGVVLAAGALFLFLRPAFGMLSTILALVLIASAIFVAVTGFAGWCPACAMVGRKLKTNQHIQ
jgi:hypothetical protein